LLNISYNFIENYVFLSSALSINPMLTVYEGVTGES